MENNLVKIKGVRKTMTSCRTKQRETYMLDYENPKNKTGFHIGAEAAVVFYEITMENLKNQIYTVIDGRPLNAPPKGPKLVLSFILELKPEEMIPEHIKKYIADQMAKSIFDKIGFWCGMMVYTINRFGSVFPGQQQLILYLLEIEDETGYKYLNQE